MTHRYASALLTLAAASWLGACAQDRAVADTTTDTAAAPTLVERTLMAGALEGTLTNAGQGAPIMVLVPGSGPTDRDGNGPLIKTNAYRQLAEALAARGVSTVRVDKRGMFGSAAAGDANAVTAAAYTDDYRAWIDAVRAETGAPCVYLGGHSEGGLMVLATAANDADGVCGLVLIAAPGRPLGTILREQLAAPPNTFLLKDAEPAIAQLERGERVDVSEMHTALQGLFAPQVQDFLISMLALQPDALMAELDLPVLVLQGDTDIQVSVEDARALEAAGGELVLLPGVNHVLKTAPKGRLRNMATYQKPDLPLADGVADAVADFIRAN